MIKIFFFNSNKDFNMNLIEPINNKSIGICNCGLDEINIYVNCDISLHLAYR